MSVIFRTDGTSQLDSLQLVQGQTLPSAEREPEVRRVLIEGLGQGRNEKLNAKAAVHGQSPLDIKNHARPILDQHVIGQGRAKAMVLNMLAARDGVHADGVVVSGPAGTGKTMMSAGIAHAVNGDPEARVHIEGATIRSVQDVFKYIGSLPGYIGSGEQDPAPFGAMNLAKRIGKGTLVVDIDEIDKIPDDALRVLAAFMMPLFTAGKLRHPNGAESEHPGAIIAVNAHDAASGAKFFALIKELAAKEKETPPLADHLVARMQAPVKLEKLDQQGLTELAKRALRRIANEWPDKMDLGVESDVAAHLAALAWKSGSVEKSGARELLGAVDRLVRQVLSIASEATLGSRFELRVNPDAKKDLAPYVEAFSQRKLSLESLGLEMV